MEDGCGDCGDCFGDGLGFLDGDFVGAFEGFDEGDGLGFFDGAFVGAGVTRRTDGDLLGESVSVSSVGLELGGSVIVAVGLVDGEGVGLSVGDTVDGSTDNEGDADGCIEIVGCGDLVGG